MTQQLVARGKPAEYGQEVVKRRARITAALVSLKGKSVLDFGAGNGAQTLELLTNGCQIVACDIDDGDLAVLQDYLTTRSITAVRPVLYGGGRLPLPDEHFDLVVSYQVLEHVEDESLALAEMHRVSKPGGDLVISVPNRWWVFETHGARLPLLPWNRVPLFSWLPKAIHSRYARARIYRRQDIIALLMRHGFEIMSASYMTAPMDMVRSPWLKRFLRRTLFRSERTRLPFLATEIFIHARKP